MNGKAVIPENSLTKRRLFVICSSIWTIPKNLRKPRPSRKSRRMRSKNGKSSSSATWRNIRWESESLLRPEVSWMKKMVSYTVLKISLLLEVTKLHLVARVWCACPNQKQIRKTTLQPRPGNALATNLKLPVSVRFQGHKVQRIGLERAKTGRDETGRRISAQHADGEGKTRFGKEAQRKLLGKHRILLQALELLKNK